MANKKRIFIGGLALMVVWVSMGGIKIASAVSAREVGSTFFYDFRVNGTLEEAWPMDSSSSPYFWLNSGAYMTLKDGVGRTVLGELPSSNKWRLLYAASNPLDMDNGYHPQNLFRLVTRSKWQNFRQEGYFQIKKDNLSASPNRNQSNGILFFNRYNGDGQTLYYTGVRVDGAAVVKKKINGKYFTMASKKILNGTYNSSSNPNLMPKDTWIGLRSEVKTWPEGKVSIKLFTDVGKTGKWTLALDVIDDGSSYGGGAITQEAFAGIRRDFMDVIFDDYRLRKF